MPEGPNKSEELLKRYTKERREQAPKLSLHPATRRLLQGEVAREFGKNNAVEQRGWAMWLGILRGRLAIGTALGVVAVTGVCFWWNNQKPQPVEMAKAERLENEFTQTAPRDLSDVKLQAKKESVAVVASAPVQLEGEARRLALAPSATTALKADTKANLLVVAPTEGALAGQRASALYDAPALDKASTSSSTTLLARGVGSSSDFNFGAGSLPAQQGLATAAVPPGNMAFGGSATGSLSRAAYFGTTTGAQSVTNQTILSFAYNAPNDGLALPQPGASPSVATLGDTAGKNLSKLSEIDKLAAEPSLASAARPDAGGLERARHVGPETQAPTPQLPAAPAATSRPLAETVATDKRQQPTTSPQSPGELAAQTSAARPESAEPLTRFYRESTAVTESAAKQKALRELERTGSESTVLSRFVIEQTGSSVRVVDADGSVYDGKVEEPVVTEFDSDRFEAFAESKDQLAREKPVALKSALASPTDGYSFRASGSNLTLRQMVVVNGRFAAGTNTVARRGTGGAVSTSSSRSTISKAPAPKGGAVSNRANASPQPGFAGRYGAATNQPATLEGTVRIGMTNQQWFRAVLDTR